MVGLINKIRQQNKIKEQNSQITHFDHNQRNTFELNAYVFN